MDKSIAPTKLTGGGGFEFEDKVAAYFLSLLLSKRPPLDPSFGIITKLRLQVQADNWLLDDLLLTLDDGTTQKNCAFSIKSNAQFSKTSAPSDFVRNAWLQYLETEGAPFIRTQDRLGLITTPLPTDTKVNIENILNKARAQDPAELYRHIMKDGYVSQEARSLFLSFKCPDDLAQKHSKDERNIGELLSHLEHLEFDFEHTSSLKLNETISILREALISNDLNEARKLWDSLCAFARERKPHGGFVDLQLLVNRIKRDFSLTVFPDHKAFWDIRKKSTTSEMHLIPDKIAQSIHINRDSIYSEIKSKVDEHRIIVILGESGSGKTVIEKHFAELLFNTYKVIWINKDTLPDPSDSDYFEPFKLIPDTSAYVILDGLDKYYDDRLKAVAALFNACFYNVLSSPWRFIISCQPEEWARVQNSLAGFNITPKWELYELKALTFQELQPVWDSYPVLKKLAYHTHLQGFLFKPKILDLFARRIADKGAFDEDAFGEGFFKGSPIGESHLIDWYWEQQVELASQGLNKDRLLKDIAGRLADELILEVPSSEFTGSDLTAIEDLIKERLLCKRNSRISFEHDLIADWARLRILIEHVSDIENFLCDRLSSPLWCKALRLLGTYTLETSQDTEAWRKLFVSFAAREEIDSIAQDLLLESSIFSSDLKGNLEKIWEELRRDDGKLLRRFLRRFLYTATFPSQLALVFATAYKDEATSDIITRFRDPYWFYWIPVINFLYAHTEDVIKFAKMDIAEICDKWLRYSKGNWFGREEAADIAIHLAEDLLALSMSNIHFYDQGRYSKVIYRAAIASCKEQPDRIFDFVLTACSRKEPSGRILEHINKYNEKAEMEAAERKRKIDEEALAKLQKDATFYPFYDDGPTPSPWPDGPKYNVNREFHDLCMQSEEYSDSLYPLIESFPDVAMEVILALLIEPPKLKIRERYPLREYTGLDDYLRWFPPFYTRGPFLFFLNKHPDMGLSLIIRLINFAVDRWAEKWVDDGEIPPNITIHLHEGEKKYIGDARVYYWHRDVGTVSDVIPSALMALEWWLYDKYKEENTKDIARESIKRILEEGDSLAFIGLLITFGKKYPELFTDQLLPLLSVPEFYSWNTEHIIKSEHHQMIGWMGKGEAMIKLAQEWNSMEHRKYDLMDIGPRIFLLIKSTRPAFQQYREFWIQRYENEDFYTVSPEILENLINWYDISKWKFEEKEDGINYEFDMPDEIKQKRLEGQKELQDRQALIFLPMQFRRILDGELDISSMDAESIWKTIEYVSNINIDSDDPEADILQKENAICGGIAVLFKLFEDWLISNPDKEMWCINKISELILNPLPAGSFDSDVSISPWAWDRYCAEVMPLIWTRDPSDTLYRRCMAALVLNKHYETVGILFRSASSLRRDLGKHFKQLLNFMIRLAHARWKFYRDHYSGKKTFDVNKWIEKETDLFEKGKTPHIVESWHDIAKEEMSRRAKLYEKGKKRRGDRWKPPKDEYFDFWLMKAALGWMPPLNQAINSEERAEWIHFWKQAISWTVNILETDERGEISGTPSDWDRWIFEQMAIQILELEDNENPDELWRPILELGAEGHYWVDDFLMEYFIKGIGYETVSNNFIKRWKQILEYALASEKWSTSRGRFWFYKNKLWCELLGMNYIIAELWKDDKESIITDMKAYYERWARDLLNDPESAVFFIYFLKRPASRNLLPDALVWLNNASDKVGEAFFTDRHHDVQTPLADLLELSWKRYKIAIKGNPASYEAYMNLLRKLVDLQNPQAIEIQQNLHRTK